MTFRNSLLIGARRFAAGIDVSGQAVRLVVLSRRARPTGRLRLEYVATLPLAAGAMEGAEIVDRHAVACALRDVFAGIPRACSPHALSCAMALPASATLVSSLPLTRLAVQSGVFGDYGRDIAALEPVVLVEAERMAGIERAALAVDWFVDERSSLSQLITIAATSRRHLDARVEALAKAGIALSTLDYEPYAALRAMRFAACHEIDPDAPYVAIWMGPEGVYGWRMIDGVIDSEMRYPALEHSDFTDALRYLAGVIRLDCALIAGDLDLLEGVGFTLGDVSEVLDCTVIPFATVALGEAARPLTDALLHDSASAVAFGLALREVLE